MRAGKWVIQPAGVSHFAAAQPRKMHQDCCIPELCAPVNRARQNADISGCMFDRGSDTMRWWSETVIKVHNIFHILLKYCTSAKIW